MTDKILFWIDNYLTYFGIAKSLQLTYDFEAFAIIEIPERPKLFFQQQQIVKFQKTWYFHDHVIKSKKPDLDYLKDFEERYRINLWLLAYNERIFYNYNELYKFSEDEVLSIVEQECKLFEKILNEVNPDFIIMKTTDLHYHKLFHSICKARGIKILMLRHIRFGGRCVISHDMETIDSLEKFMESSCKERTYDELQKFLKGVDYYKVISDYTNSFMASKKSLIKAILKFLFSDYSSIKKNFTYSGRTKFKVLWLHFKWIFIEKSRQFFIDKKFVRDIDLKTPFIYYPLHVQIESVLLIGAPFLTNQLETITHIVKSMPVGYQLYVKDAPMNKGRGWRDLPFYNAIMKLPNVKLLHPSVNPIEIIKNCSLVVSVSGTTALEAAFYEKPSIVFVDTDFSILPSVYKLNSIEELPNAIRLSLKKSIDITPLQKYVNFIENNSFLLDDFKLLQESDRMFYYGGFLQDVYLKDDDVISFLEKFESDFQLLALEHIKKIKQYKNHE